ncbi:hypothetical protein LR48_Vigan07g001300 [Vigna angularis]|uniref:DNA sliding clamp PCNA n=2 Tax=Phaseolus angularis TaxID=3914 RepID=A0A0L9UUT5_PHAAN|nr:proliferating cell nuclear antigen [Vigna angularis]KAG2390704.1 Proliferating cell nuclear antigen [Vigna angularis]KOM46309.1 hypothetical protein LR48_Vigan07g001300 [Vigna angularis]BAT80542.1 hypothetical protein VIGAN_03013200 [Vigna angularis var. angularis]
MVRACVLQGSILKKVVEATKDVAAEGANLVFSTVGFSLKATNPSLGAIVAVVLPADAFDSYHGVCTVSMIVDLHCMSRIFHVSSEDDIITVEECPEPEGVSLVFQNPRHDKTSEFRMKEISIDKEWLLHPLHIPEVEHHSILETENLATLKMPSLVFQRICSELADIGDSGSVLVTIKVTEEAIKFKTKGELGTSIVTCSQKFDVQKPEESVVIEMNEPVRVKFSLKLINSVTKAASLSDRVTINFLREMPSVFEYKIAQTGYARFYLHPSKEL